MRVPAVPDQFDEPARTHRGFSHYPEIPGSYGGHVKLRESSAAEHPHVWLYVTEPDDLNAFGVADASGQVYDGGYHEATVHLSIEAAFALARQLDSLVENHYQGGSAAGVLSDWRAERIARGARA